MESGRMMGRSHLRAISRTDGFRKMRRAMSKGDEDSRVDLVDDIAETDVAVGAGAWKICDSRGRLGINSLLGRKIVAMRMEKTAVDRRAKNESALRLRKGRRRQALRAEKKSATPMPADPAAEHDDVLIPEQAVRHAGSGENRSNGDGRRCPECRR